MQERHNPRSRVKPQMPRPGALVDVLLDRIAPADDEVSHVNPTRLQRGYLQPGEPLFTLAPQRKADEPGM